jgi:hypothetical protein
MITITFNSNTSEYNLLTVQKIAFFKELELQLLASYHGISYSRMISSDCHHVELAL